MRRRFIASLAVVSIAVACLVALEAAVRIALGIGFSDLAVIYRLNDQGYRDRPFTAERPPGTARILMAGASFLFGQSVQENDTLPRQLETQLRDLGARPVLTWNVSRQGWNTRAEVDAAIAMMDRYRFDSVILVQTYNDISLNPFEPGSTIALWVAQKWLSAHIVLSALQRTFNPYFANYWTITQGAYQDPRSAEQRQMAAALADLRDKCERQKIPLLVFYFELLAEDGDRRRVLGAETVRRLAAGLGIPFLAFPPLSAGTDLNAWRAHPLDLHPNRRGHERAAGTIAKFLAENPRFLGAAE